MVFCVGLGDTTTADVYAPVPDPRLDVPLVLLFERTFITTSRFVVHADRPAGADSADCSGNSRDFCRRACFAGDKRFAAEIKLILVDTLKGVGR